MGCRQIEQVFLRKKIRTVVQKDEIAKSAVGYYSENIGYHLQCAENKTAL
jgi:hypothetical protein